MDPSAEEIAEILGDAYFPTYSKSIQKKLYNFIDQLAFFDQLYYAKIEFVLCVSAIFMNLFHGFILSQKSMRKTSSTNVILLGMALVDVLTMGLRTYANYQLLFHYQELTDVCLEPPSYLQFQLSQLSFKFLEFSRRFSTYLSLSLVSIRAFAISQSLNPKFHFLTHPQTGYTSILINSIICALLTIPSFFTYQINSSPWFPSEDCAYPENYTKPNFFHDSQPLIIFNSFSVDTMLDAVLAKYFPVFLFILMTILLISAIRKGSKDQQKSDKTSKLVLFTTISVGFAEIPVGILYVFRSINEQTIGWVIISESFVKFCFLIYVFNTACHFLICYKLSTQYRDIVKSFVKIEKKLKARIIISVKSATITNG
ncbi:unnamed protein product [Caenorhabditis angaria]|uniref:G-protein coupled receptors family 1 profile domain-containing protein n=1 Tax=Caenorhabditis angaria TaxID=860376 RepID=A0A9P1I7W0_9PELO|nr:unnamed protein product [Caenorhabditis angaria]